MKHQAKSVRTFISAKNFEESRNFYKDLGFEESIISKGMSYFKIVETLGFYLQDYYVEDWINNSMIFVEVVNVEEYFLQLQNLSLQHKYKDVKLVPIRYEDWEANVFYTILQEYCGILERSKSKSFYPCCHYMHKIKNQAVLAFQQYKQYFAYIKNNKHFMKTTLRFLLACSMFSHSAHAQSGTVDKIK